MKNTGIKYLIILHLILGLYSLTAIFSKFAAAESFLSFRFILFYAIVLFGLFAYALAWQQIIKKMPLITAYANKGVTVIWGIFWGYFIFSEEITLRKVAGAVIIIAGVVLIVTADAREETESALFAKDEESALAAKETERAKNTGDS